MTKTLIITLATLLFAVSAYSPSETLSVAQQARTPQELCFTAWTWYETPQGDYWGSPFPTSTLGAIDLRTIPQMSNPGPIATGRGLFVLDTAGLCTVLGMPLTPNLDTRLSALESLLIEADLALPADSMTGLSIRNAIWDILTVHADPSGQTHPKPLRGSLTKPVSLILGGYGVIRSEPLSGSHLTNTEDVFRTDYIAQKASGVSLDTLRNWTGITMIKIYGEASDANADRLMPPQHRDDGFACPDMQRCTTFTDSFTDTNGTNITAHSLDTGQAWAKITGLALGSDIFEINASNQLIKDGSTGIGQEAYYVTTALGDDDNYSQIDIVSSVPASGDATWLIVRGDGDAANWDSYECRFRHNNNGGTFQKTLNNTNSLVADMTPDPDVDGGDTPKCEVSGSTLDAIVNGVSVDTVTDTSITVGKYVAIRLEEFSTLDMVWDNFEASDNIAITPQRVIIITRVMNFIRDRL